MLEQKIMDNILKTKMRTKNIIIALWKSKRLLSLSNQIFQSIINLSYSKVFSNIQLIEYFVKWEQSLKISRNKIKNI